MYHRELIKLYEATHIITRTMNVSEGETPDTVPNSEEIYEEEEVPTEEDIADEDDAEEEEEVPTEDEGIVEEN